MWKKHFLFNSKRYFLERLSRKLVQKNRHSGYIFSELEVPVLLQLLIRVFMTDLKKRVAGNRKMETKYLVIFVLSSFLKYMHMYVALAQASCSYRYWYFEFYFINILLFVWTGEKELLKNIFLIPVSHVQCTDWNFTMISSVMAITRLICQ